MLQRSIMFNFEIVSVHAGWFDVKISNDSNEAIITDSYYMGISNQSELLLVLAELSDLIQGERWLLWHDEPAGYVWHLKKMGDTLYYQIGVSTKEVYDIARASIKDEEIAEILIDGETKYIRALRSVSKAFTRYSVGDALKEYEKEWGEFPHKELELASAAIKKMELQAGGR